jgi:hypothetical protein
VLGSPHPGSREVMDPVNRLYECDLLDRHGEPIGPVAGLWLEGDRPRWAAVRTQDATTLVPIRGAQVRDRRLVLPVDKREVEGAPRVGDELSDDQQAALHYHYGLTVPAQRLTRHVRQVSEATTPPSRRATRPAR